MPSTPASVKITLHGHDVPVTSGEVQIQEWNKRDRMIRGLKVGGACWAGAVVAVILPLLHFVLVPGLLLAGPLAGYFVFLQEAVILGGQGSCPYCKETMKIVRGTPNFPLSESCDHCQKNVRVEKA